MSTLRYRQNNSYFYAIIAYIVYCNIIYNCVCISGRACARLPLDAFENLGSLDKLYCSLCLQLKHRVKQSAFAATKASDGMCVAGACEMTRSRCGFASVMFQIASTSVVDFG